MLPPRGGGVGLPASSHSLPRSLSPSPHPGAGEDTGRQGELPPTGHRSHSDPWASGSGRGRFWGRPSGPVPGSRAGLSAAGSCSLSLSLLFTTNVTTPSVGRARHPKQTQTSWEEMHV